MAKYKKWLEPNSLLLLEEWARNGLTDEMIAHNMGIAYSTLRVWRDKFSALSAALKNGKEIINIKVENSLLKKALGYTYEVKTQELRKNPENGKKELVTTMIVTREMPPDTTAIIFWLKNRRPDRWRDKFNVEGSAVRPKHWASRLTKPIFIGLIRRKSKIPNCGTPTALHEMQNHT